MHARVLVICQVSCNLRTRCALLQVLYEFIFSVGGVTSPFKIYDSFPRVEILPDVRKTIADAAILSGVLLFVEEVESFSHPLDLLQVQHHTQITSRPFLLDCIPIRNHT